MLPVAQQNSAAMSEEAGERAERSRASRGCMDPRRWEEGDEREAPAVSPCCQTLAARMVVVTVATALVLGLLCSVLVAASKADQAFKASQKDPGIQLQQCLKERQDLEQLLLSVTQDSRLCPSGWLWWRRRCYFFSVGRQENLRWNESAEFCRRHGSSLVVITEPAEMEFLLNVMRKFPQVAFLWLGLTDAEQEGRWRWSDGSDIQHYLPLTVEWDSDDRDCADLRGGGSLFAASCEAYGPWTCKRDS
ncbi:uncharacterized protein V6R79_023623 [Siganus canaliculatus]